MEIRPRVANLADAKKRRESEFSCLAGETTPGTNNKAPPHTMLHTDSLWDSRSRTGFRSRTSIKLTGL
jgi:hypothetical protein